MTKQAQSIAFILAVFISIFVAPALAQTRISNSVGTYTTRNITCPSGGLTGATCFAIDITCASVTNYTAYAKVFEQRSPLGVVSLTTGGSSNVLWENIYTYGQDTVDDLTDAGFDVAEITYGQPFIDGGAWETGGGGVRALACREATILTWLSKAFPTVPQCAAGVSAGSDLLGESLAHYNIDDVLDFVELVSGPPFQRIDQACLNNVPAAVEVCSGALTGMGAGIDNATDYLDPAYPPHLCSQSMQNHVDESGGRFLADSITTSDANLSYPNTDVKFLFGSLDTNGAPRQGTAYQSVITSTTTSGCVIGAPHDLPDDLSGAHQVATDVINHCKAHHR